MVKQKEKKKKYLHLVLVPLLGGEQEGCAAIVLSLVDLDTWMPCEGLDNVEVPPLDGAEERELANVASLGGVNPHILE